MFNAVKENYINQDYIIMSAAVADYTVKDISLNKIKKSSDSISLELSRTNDILKYVGENKTNQKLIGFSMETENLIDNSKVKLEKKNADMICANSISDNKTGFGVDTNKITLIKKDEIKELPFGTKKELASLILDEIKKL